MLALPLAFKDPFNTPTQCFKILRDNKIVSLGYYFCTFYKSEVLGTLINLRNINKRFLDLLGHIYTSQERISIYLLILTPPLLNQVV